MSLLAPLFLLGLFAIALPLWLHRMNYSDPPSQHFSSVRLMRHSEQTASTEKQLRYLLLLATRILALAILAFLFAEPAFRTNNALVSGTEQQHNLIVLDQSLSMSAPDVWQDVVNKAKVRVEAMQNFETAQIIGAGSEVSLVTEVTADKGELIQAISRLEPKYVSLDYGQLVSTLDDIAVNNGSSGDARDAIPTLIYFISDAQASNLPVRFSDLVPNRAMGLELDIAGGTAQVFNWSVSAQYDRDKVVANIVSYNSPARQMQVDLLINGETRASQTLDIPASGSAIATFDELALELDETRLEVRLNSPAPNIQFGDSLIADNRYFISANSLEALSVLILAADPSLQDTLFLDTALRSIADPIIETDVMFGGGSVNFAMDEYDLVVINDIAALSENVTEALRTFAERGGNLLSIAGPLTHSAGEFGLTDHSFGESDSFAANDSQGLLVQQPLHGSVSAFEGAINAQLYQPLEMQLLEGDSLIASTNNGYPWLVEHSMGLGRNLIVAHSLLPASTDLSVAPEFVPLLRSWMTYLGDSGNLPDEYETGEQIQVGLDLDQNRSAAVQQVFLPNGKPLLSLSQQSQIQGVRFEQPGIYGLQTARGEHLVAVNTPTVESDLTQIPQALLAQWRNLSSVQEINPVELINSGSGVESTSLKSIEDWLLPLLILIILIESVLGNTHLNVRREIVR
jgi:hypothetical protein